MNFVTLFIIILAVTLIINVLRSYPPAYGIDGEHTYLEDLQDQDLQSDVNLQGVQFVPGIDLGKAADFLQEEYWQYFEHARDEPYVIPQMNAVVGNIRMMIVWREVIVCVGTHSELRFETIDLAFRFIAKVLKDGVVFRIGEEETQIFPIEDFEGPGDAGRNDHVWSGPLKYKLLFRT
jgi:hypothetical protein